MVNSSDKVLALKYRPRRFEDLVGQSSISQTLSLALDMKRLPHAYLFSGLRGSGKTSTARIMAKSLLCDIGPTSKPCEKCQNCLSANSSRHLDIIEMDAASNRGIEDIKELIEHTKYQPSSARYKVFIIDEVHMLTTQAFNALLKTLEEPPAFVKFILATTDPLKLPPTILSRTQHFRFKAIALKDIIHHIEHLLHLENIPYEQKAVELIARSGQGSLRDTLTLLDQAIIYSKGNITSSSVTDLLGLIDPSMMDKIFDMILHQRAVLEIVELLEEYESDLIIDEMAIFLKQQLLNKNILFNTAIIDRFFRILGDSKYLLSLNSDSEFVLVLMISKMIEATKLQSIDSIIQELEKKHCDILNVQVPCNVPKQQETKTSNQNNQEEIEQTVIKEIPKTIEQEDVGTIKFQKITKALYDRSYDLGECFEKNFLFKEYEEDKNILHIISIADGDCKQLLWKHFAYIRTVVEEFFTIGVKIEFHKQTLEEESKKKEPITSTKEIDNTTTQAPSCESDEVSSMVEEETFGSGCVADMSGIDNTNVSSKEMQLNELLQTPFVSKAKELFDPKKIIVKSKI